MKKLVTSELVLKAQIAERYFQIGLLCPYIASNIVPGQFIQVRISKVSNDPLLCRPFAVYRIRGDFIDVMFKVVGRGTRLLSEKAIGDTLDITGPLGNGFPTDSDFQVAILVAGGMGVAGLMLLAEKLKGRRIITLIGACSQDRILGKNDLLNLGAEVHTSTEDGSSGYKGLVSQLLEDVMLREKSTTVTHRIFACGPPPMLKAVARIASEHKIRAYVSLEERMACGVGACLGCACAVVSPDRRYKMVCTDGPVFDAQEILWE